MTDQRPTCPKCSGAWFESRGGERVCLLCGWSGPTRSPDAKERRAQRGHAAPRFAADDDGWRRLLILAGADRAKAKESS